MQYDAKTPAEYIKNLEKDWRLEKLQEIRKIIKALDPKVKEVIRYKMLGFNYDGEVLCNLNAQSAYVALYVGDTSKLDSTGKLLEGLNCGKGCIRFKKSNEVIEKNLKKLLKENIKMIKKGEQVYR